ncbi:uncharacterized protein N7511_008603 [Penicillium nucicola]|uniref:uncharacterized protein n=1 Tax=Penicillium nucicola TaxID=1850975 RepID=UPI0025453DFF|nr:uncharacterized protein N7511_008603 [Penicillium nucicola]KAJ5746907.1 hypothetical protein N7511_008603 [Penicillium nucicola]
MPSLMKLVATALAVAPAVAQTFSDCNPLQATCPANPGTTESDLVFDFTQSNALGKWKTTAGTVNTGGSNGAAFTINKLGDAPTIQTDFYFFYGEISVEMKTAPGQGIVSSIVLESDDLDEIDWEGIGGNNGQIETNYFGKGDTTTYDRATWVALATPEDVFHKYTINWSKEAIVWSIDGTPIRTVNYADAKGGTRFPQTPMNLRIGIWAGGSSDQPGTVTWAGGATDYSAAPFSMYIKSVEIKNANPAESYTYSDKSGSSDSIKFTGSNAVSARSTTSSAAPTSTTETSAAETSSVAAATTTETSASVAPTTEASSTPTTMVTAAQSSSASASASASAAGSSTAASTGASSSAASGASESSSAAGPTETGSGSSSSGSSSTGGSTETGSGSSSGSSSSAGTSTSASASASSSPAFNAASSLAASYMGPVSMLALAAAFFQL